MEKEIKNFLNEFNIIPVDIYNRSISNKNKERYNINNIAESYILCSCCLEKNLSESYNQLSLKNNIKNIKIKEINKKFNKLLGNRQISFKKRRILFNKLILKFIEKENYQLSYIKCHNCSFIDKTFQESA